MAKSEKQEWSQSDIRFVNGELQLSWPIIAPDDPEDKDSVERAKALMLSRATLRLAYNGGGRGPTTMSPVKFRDLIATVCGPKAVPEVLQKLAERQAEARERNQAVVDTSDCPFLS